ncbi:hypothetical protein ABIA39_001000 [Nocardia sp. GAS34]|jgi:hypothetical protein|uniref:GNAT family N-acetyltransferase n=1 Tax=unclassified Nocardia TaxID=2637762 RepID=UPI003D25BBF9
MLPAVTIDCGDGDLHPGFGSTRIRRRTARRGVLHAGGRGHRPACCCWWSRPRGRGVGSPLVEHYLGFAAAAGYREMVLWTNDVLTSARHIYQRAGFELVESAPHHSFGKDLTGQTWRRPLH